MESTVGIRWAFSPKRQSAYATALANADLTLSPPFEGADFGEHTPNMSDNAALFGKGHEFATRNYLLSWDSRFRRSAFLTTKLAGWAFAFHTGKVTTTPADIGPPAAHQHVFEYQDPFDVGYYGSGRQLPVTTVVEQATSGLVRKFPSMVVSALELSGKMNDFCRIGVDLIGSGMMSRIPATGVGSMTWPVGASGDEGDRLRNTAMLFEHGETGALADVSCDIRSWRFRSEYSLAEDDGYCPGSGYLTPGDPSSGQVRNKLEFLRRACMLEWVVRAGSGVTLFENLEQQVELAAKVTLTGTDINATDANQVIVNVPRLMYRAVPIGSDGDIITYALSTVVFYDDTLANPWEVTVTNDVAEYLTAAV
ncbi:hypothetical protein BH24ACT15_BH24ACT15_34870 [soil metagenome]